MVDYCEVPKLRKGEIYSNGDLEYKILGIKEVTADYLARRKGLVYEIKDNKCKYSYSVPCWYLEKKNKEFGYILINKK